MTLAEGKPTLTATLCYPAWHTSASDALIRDAIEKANGMEHFDEIMLALA